MRPRVVAIALLLVTLPAASACGQGIRTEEIVDKAQQLLREGQNEEAQPLIDSLTAKAYRVRLTFNIILVRRQFFNQLPLEAKKLVLPVSTSVLIKVWPERMGIAGTRIIAACEKDQVDGELLMEYAMRSKYATVATSFMLKRPVIDGQRLELSLSPDRMFTTVSGPESSGEPEQKFLLITMRPIVDRDGEGLVMLLFDPPMAPEVLPVAKLSTLVPWECPGAPDVAIQPPMFDVEPRYSGFGSGVHLASFDFILIHRISAPAEREVVNAVPIVSRLPLFGKVFIDRTVEKEVLKIYMLVQAKIFAPRKK